MLLLSRVSSRAALVICLNLSAACASRADRSTYSVVEASKIPQAQSFDAPTTLSLSEVFRLGRDGGDVPESFGHIAGVAVGSDSSLYITDTKLAHVTVFDAQGHFKRYIGRRGTGSGGLLNPTAIMVSGARVTVYDASLRALVSFDTAGSFINSAPLSDVLFVSDIQTLAANTVLVTAARNPNGWVAAYDLSTGALRTTYIRGFTNSGADSIPRAPAAGRMCVLNTTEIVFANPFIYELVGFNASTKANDWTREWKSNVLGVESRVVNGTTRELPTAGLLGLVCSPTQIVLAYIDVSSLKLYYDFFTTSGDPIGRLTFTRRGTSMFPGFAAALLGDRLVTFRTKPFSQVFVYRVVTSKSRVAPNGSRP